MGDIEAFARYFVTLQSDQEELKYAAFQVPALVGVRFNRTRRN